MTRLFPLLRLAPVTHELIGVIGAFTAIFAASIALFQQDIKKVLAYSTLSQLGYMFLGVGVGAYTAAVFHFLTHAFFKALLFLAAGSVIHALGGEQDLARMGGLARKLPITMWTFLVGTVAISGIWPLSGYFSKEALLGAAYNSGHFGLWMVGVVTAGMTAFYMFRLFFVAFLGQARDQALYDHAHESPAVMSIPLIILAVLAVVGGAFGGILNGWLAPVFARYPGASHAALSAGPVWTTILTVGLAVVGIALAYGLFGRRQLSPRAGTEKAPGSWMLDAWKMDALWTLVGIVPSKIIGDMLRTFEVGVLRTVDGIAQGVWAWAEDLRPIQGGLIRRYALSITVGLFAIMAYYLLQSGFIG